MVVNNAANSQRVGQLLRQFGAQHDHVGSCSVHLQEEALRCLASLNDSALARLDVVTPLCALLKSAGTAEPRVAQAALALANRLATAKPTLLPASAAPQLIPLLAKDGLAQSASHTLLALICTDQTAAIYEIWKWVDENACGDDTLLTYCGYIGIVYKFGLQAMRVCRHCPRLAKPGCICCYQPLSAAINNTSMCLRQKREYSSRTNSFYHNLAREATIATQMMAALTAESTPVDAKQLYDKATSGIQQGIQVVLSLLSEDPDACIYVGEGQEDTVLRASKPEWANRLVWSKTPLLLLPNDDTLTVEDAIHKYGIRFIPFGPTTHAVCSQIIESGVHGLVRMMGLDKVQSGRWSNDNLKQLLWTFAGAGGAKGVGRFLQFATKVPSESAKLLKLTRSSDHPEPSFASPLRSALGGFVVMPKPPPLKLEPGKWPGELKVKDNNFEPAYPDVADTPIRTCVFIDFEHCADKAMIAVEPFGFGAAFGKNDGVRLLRMGETLNSFLRISQNLSRDVRNLSSNYPTDARLKSDEFPTLATFILEFVSRARSIEGEITIIVWRASTDIPILMHALYLAYPDEQPSVVLARAGIRRFLDFQQLCDNISLEDAHKKHVGVPQESAHCAGADAESTLAVAASKHGLPILNSEAARAACVPILEAQHEFICKMASITTNVLMEAASRDVQFLTLDSSEPDGPLKRVACLRATGAHGYLYKEIYTRSRGIVHRVFQTRPSYYQLNMLDLRPFDFTKDATELDGLVKRAIADATKGSTKGRVYELCDPIHPAIEAPPPPPTITDESDGAVGVVAASSGASTSAAALEPPPQQQQPPPPLPPPPPQQQPPPPPLQQQPQQPAITADAITLLPPQRAQPSPPPQQQPTQGVVMQAPVAPAPASSSSFTTDSWPFSATAMTGEVTPLLFAYLPPNVASSTTAPPPPPRHSRVATAPVMPPQQPPLQQQPVLAAAASASVDSAAAAASSVSKGAWSQNEDQRLSAAVAQHGASDWPKIAAIVGGGRKEKQCRERWLNVLCPGVKKGDWTEEEDRLITEGVAELGTRWSKIAKRLPGRTDKAIKDRWNLKQRKEQRKKKRTDSEEQHEAKSQRMEGPIDAAE